MRVSSMERSGRRVKAGSLSGLSGALPGGHGAGVRRQRSLEWAGDRSSDDDRPQPPLADRVFASLLAEATQQFDENRDSEQYLNPTEETNSIALEYEEVMNTHIKEPSTLEPPELPTLNDVAALSELPNISEQEPNSDLNPELLKALGSFEEESSDWGEPIIEHIAMRLKPLIVNGFKNEEREVLIKKFPCPKNMALAKAPTLNAEISAMLSETSRNRDKRLFNKQNQLGGALTAITRAMSLLFCHDPKISDVLAILSDASKLLADSHSLETDTRKTLIIPLVDKDLIESFKDRKRDAYLFGDQLGELVKNSRGIKRTGQLIQASTSTSNLNYKGPSSRGRSQKNYLNRGGGLQRPYRRTGMYVPPPPPPRRPPPSHYAPQWRRPPPASSVTQRPAAQTKNARQ